MLPSIEWWISLKWTWPNHISSSILFSQTLSKNFWNPLHPLILLLFFRTFVIHMSNKWWWDSDYDFHGTKKYDELGSEYPKKEINIARIGLISNRLTEDTHFIEGLDEFYSILKINDHTGSIKLETRPCPCSEERIESERHVNRTNELLHMANKKKKEHMGAGKVEKERGKKKKKTETVVGRTIVRTLDWMDFWWNFRAVLSLGGARLSLCLYSMLHCFRKYLFSPRFLADNTDATPCFYVSVQTKATMLKTRDEGITIRDFHYFVPFVPSFLSKNNLANAFWETRWIRCCWS